jgi:hypothetical protein
MPMGAWGTGPFENDDALDWVWELEEGGERVVRAALQAAVSAKGTYDADTGVASNAVAAAEVVAALRGRPYNKVPEEVEQWLSSAARPPQPDLLDLARRAVERVRSDSELKECWDEAPDPSDRDAWYAAMDDLLARLG